MYSPIGLEHWEVVVASGIGAAAAVAFAFGVGGALAWMIYGLPGAERRPVAKPVAATKSEPRPALATKPDYAAA